MRYPAKLTVTRESSTSTSSMGGTTTSGSTTVYSGQADVQDRKVMFRTEDGQLINEGDAEAFFPDRFDVESFKVGDSATITFESGTEKTGRIARVRLLDDSVVIKYD